MLVRLAYILLLATLLSTACIGRGRTGGATSVERQAHQPTLLRDQPEQPPDAGTVVDDAEFKALVREMQSGSRGAFARLAGLGPGEGRLEHFVLLLEDEAQPAAWVAEVLASWGERSSPAAPALGVRLARGTDVHAYAHALIHIGRASSPALLHVLESDTVPAAARAAAARALGLVEQNGDGRAARAAIRALSAPEESIRVAASSALMQLWRSLPARAGEALLTATHDPSDLVRANAVHGLGDLASSAGVSSDLVSRVLLRFAEMLRAGDGRTDAELLEAVEALGPLGTSLIPELLVIARSEKWAVAADAGLVLFALGVNTPELRRLVANAVSRDGWDDLRFATALFACGRDQWAGAAGACLSVLGNSGTASIDRLEAIRLLAVVGVALPERAQSVLSQLSDDDDRAVVRAAAEATRTLRALLAGQ